MEVDHQESQDLVIGIVLIVELPETLRTKLSVLNVKHQSQVNFLNVKLKNILAKVEMSLC